MGLDKKGSFDQYEEAENLFGSFKKPANADEFVHIEANHSPKCPPEVQLDDACMCAAEGAEAFEPMCHPQFNLNAETCECEGNSECSAPEEKCADEG